MKLKVFAAGLIASVALWTTGPVDAASYPGRVVPEASRSIDGGLTVEIIVAQDEIASKIQKSLVPGTGVVGVLVAGAIDKARTERSDAEIIPIRAGLAGFDVDALALAAAKVTTSRYSWIAPLPSAVSRSPSILSEGRGIATASASPATYFAYSYDLTPDFSAIRVSLHILIVDEAASQVVNQQARRQASQILYAQTVTCWVSLPNATAELKVNARRWSAEDGRLARLALTQAFTEVGALGERALGLTEADILVMSGKDKKKLVAGRLQETGPNGFLLFDGGLIRLQTLAQ